MNDEVKKFYSDLNLPVHKIIARGMKGYGCPKDVLEAEIEATYHQIQSGQLELRRNQIARHIWKGATHQDAVNKRGTFFEDDKIEKFYWDLNLPINKIIEKGVSGYGCPEDAIKEEIKAVYNEIQSGELVLKRYQIARCIWSRAMKREATNQMIRHMIYPFYYRDYFWAGVLIFIALAFYFLEWWDLI